MELVNFSSKIAQTGLLQTAMLWLEGSLDLWQVYRMLVHLLEQ